MKRLALILAAACLCACQATSTWQTYDETSYAATMDPSEAVLAKHIAALEIWVEGPADAVPPGIYTELAYWLTKVGRTDEARVLFEREIARYPYAQKYVQLLMSVVLPATGGEPKSPPAKPAVEAVKFVVLLALLACGCQASQAADEEDWTNFYEHQPTSILVLPVQNETSAAEAPIAFSSTITHPLVERGYYIFPVQPTLAILEANGIYEGGQLETIEPQKFYEILGADAVLYVTLKSWDTHYAVIASSVEVAMDYRMFDAHTGELLWQNSARQVVSSDSGGGGGDPLAALLSAVIESAMNASATDYVPLARQANFVALGALPPGPLSDQHDKVRQDLLARSKPAPAKPKP